jgi:hypothetical protein
MTNLPAGFLGAQTPKFYLAGSIEPKVRRARKSGFLRSIDRKNPQFEQALRDSIPGKGGVRRKAEAACALDTIIREIRKGELDADAAISIVKALKERCLIDIGAVPVEKGSADFAGFLRACSKSGILALQTPKFYLAGSIEPKVRRARKS